jgi:hypothetical protein
LQEQKKIHFCRGINEFKKGYQPKTNFVKDKYGDLFADTNIIFNSYYVLNIHGVNDIRLTETHSAGQTVHERSSFELEIAIQKWKRYTSPGTDEIPAELIKAGGTYYVLKYTNVLILFAIWKNCHSSGRNQ